MKQAFIWSVSAFIISSVALSAPVKKAIPKVKYEPFPVEQVIQSSLHWNAETLKAEIKKIEKAGKRTIAAADAKDEASVMSYSARNLRSDFIGGPKYDKNNQEIPNSTVAGVKDEASLDKFLSNLDDSSEEAKKYYNELSDDAKWVAAQIAPLRAYRGVLNRARLLLEQAKFMHSMVATFFRLAATGFFAYLPTHQWESGLKYISAPYDKMKPDIDTDQKLQDFLLSEVIPAIDLASRRLRALSFANRYIHFDNKFLYSQGNFAIDEGRYRFIVIGEAERQSVIATYEYTLSALYSLGAYESNGLIKTINALSELFGYDVGKGSVSNFFGFTSGDDLGIHGVSAKKRFETIKVAGKKLNLMKRRSNWKSLMGSSLKSFDNGVAAMRLAHTAMKQIPEGERNDLNFLLAPNAFLAFNRSIESTLDEFEKLLDRENLHPEGVLISSNIVSGDAIRVKFKELFTNAPADLMAFAPNGFEEYRDESKGFVRSMTITNTSGKQEERTYHYYLHERPVRWNNDAFKPYFPGIESYDLTESETKELARLKADSATEGKKFNPDQEALRLRNNRVKTAARILSQSWGGWIIGMPLGLVVY